MLHRKVGVGFDGANMVKECFGLISPDAQFCFVIVSESEILDTQAPVLGHI